MSKPKYDFAGFVTKNDVRCTDGVTIKHDAFKDNDGTKVPLVWNHNTSIPTNVIGSIMLQSHEEGVYGFGEFNGSEEGQHAKELVKHGDITSMSIGARKIQKKGQDVIHGLIYEVSLVLAGANPGAIIEQVMNHNDEETDSVVIEGIGSLIHMADDVLEFKEKGELEMAEETTVEVTETVEEGGKETIGTVLDTLSDKQMAAVEQLLAEALGDEEEVEETVEETTTVEQNDKGGKTMKHNVFNASAAGGEEVLTHAQKLDVFKRAQDLGSLQAAMKEVSLEHSITNLEVLFPEAKLAPNEIIIIRDDRTAAGRIMEAVNKSPFSKLKSIYADMTEDEARARGYIKGDEKIDQIFELLSRETAPQTVYKKQSMDRDDLIDITDFNMVAFINKEMRTMLFEELARAILVGDGREITDKSKIKNDKIRPIISDNNFYTIKKNATDVSKVIEIIIKADAEYRGSGVPSLYIDPRVLADLKLLKGDDGRFLFGEIPSTEALAARLGVDKIIPTTLLKDSMLMVNLHDYTVGTDKGGEVTNFEQFDIDYNKHKYLIETRLSGSLMYPKSAVYITVGGTPIVDNTDPKYPSGVAPTPEAIEGD